MGAGRRPRFNLAPSMPQSLWSLSRNLQWFKPKLPRPALKFMLPSSPCTWSRPASSSSFAKYQLLPALLFPLSWEHWDANRGLKITPSTGAETQVKDSCRGREWTQSPAPSPLTSTPANVLWNVTNGSWPTQFMKYGGACTSSTQLFKWLSESAWWLSEIWFARIKLYVL